MDVVLHSPSDTRGPTDTLARGGGARRCPLAPAQSIGRRRLFRRPPVPLQPGFESGPSRAHAVCPYQIPVDHWAMSIFLEGQGCLDRSALPGSTCSAFSPFDGSEAPSLENF